MKISFVLLPLSMNAISDNFLAFLPAEEEVEEEEIRVKGTFD